MARKKRKRQPLDMDKIFDEDKAWFRYYNEVFAPKYGWPKLPIGIGYWSYRKMLNLIKEWGETLPTWKELEAGEEATASFPEADGPMTVNQPWWIVQAKVNGDTDTGIPYPNVLFLRNFALEGRASGKTIREFQG